MITKDPYFKSCVSIIDHIQRKTAHVSETFEEVIEAKILSPNRKVVEAQLASVVCKSSHPLESQIPSLSTQSSDLARMNWSPKSISSNLPASLSRGGVCVSKLSLHLTLDYHKSA